MNWKSTGILLFAAAVLFVFIWTVERPIRKQRLQDTSRVILPAFNPAVIDHIEISPRGLDEIHAVRLEGTNGQWQLVRPIAYPARGEAIKALLDAIAGLQWQVRIGVDELKNEPDAQQKYGFSQALCEISMQGPGTSEKILIGQPSALGDQVFLEVVGNPDIYLVNLAWLKFMPLNKDQWRDLTLLNLAGLSYDSIQVRSPGGGFDLERDSTNQLWFMRKPVNARADSARINEGLERLRALRVHQFVPDTAAADLETYGLQTSAQPPALALSFWQGTNLAAELQVGDSVTNEHGMAFARRASPSNIVVIARDALLPWQGAYTNFLDYHFISMSPDSIGHINVRGTGHDGTFDVQKQGDGHWEISGAAPFPADADLMRSWLASFTNIHVQIEKTVATDLQPYGLAHPPLQYTLFGPSNAVIAQIQFGANSNGVIFEHRPDESSVNVVNPNDFAGLPRFAWQLRDRHIWSFDSSNVVSVAIHQLGATRKYLRDPEGDWTLDASSAGPLVNWPSLEEGLYRLGRLQAVYWAGAGDMPGRDLGFAGADFNLTLGVKQNGKTETYSIAFGGRSPYSYPYAAVVQNGQRLVFEFPVDLYENFVEPDMTIPASMRPHH